MSDERPLFDLSDFPAVEVKSTGPTFAPLRYPLWTEHKAALIARYLYYFVMITKHGTYIDGFAGKQNDHDSMWAARLVSESEPRWLRHLHLVEIDDKKIPDLLALKTSQDN